jgi:hypothetical protein
LFSAVMIGESIVRSTAEMHDPGVALWAEVNVVTAESTKSSAIRLLFANVVSRFWRSQPTTGETPSEAIMYLPAV